MPNKVKKPKGAKSRKTHCKASARAYSGVEAAEHEADQAEQISKKAGKQLTRKEPLKIAVTGTFGCRRRR